jgi:hypothetical protein
MTSFDLKKKKENLLSNQATKIYTKKEERRKPYLQDKINKTYN